MYQPKYDDVSEKVTTPAYVFDVDVLKDRIAFIKNILGEAVNLCYAMKANPFLVDAMVENIQKYEVCSPGEFKICERAGIPMDKIILSGVYKEEHDMKRIIQTYEDTITYTCESSHQFHLINKIAESLHIRVKVLLRVTTGNQFGMDESVLCEIVEHRNNFKGVKIIGIHHFSGTQRKTISKFQEELAYVDKLIWKLEESYGYTTKELEFGPGFYVEYFKNAKPYDEKGLIQDFKQALDGMQFKGKITIELGRFIAATCGHYYTQIVDKKCNNNRKYCMIDGGMHQIVYFGQLMGMKIPSYKHLQKRCTEGAYDTYNIAGSLCTTNDNLVKELPLSNPELGDILEFHNAGAYAMCEGMSLFLSRDLPRVYLYTKDTGLTLLRDVFETNVLNYRKS